MCIFSLLRTLLTLADHLKGQDALHENYQNNKNPDENVVILKLIIDNKVSFRSVVVEFQI